MIFSMPVWAYLIVGPLSFLAGFIDSIAGGGGLVSIPAYTLANVPGDLLLGTNKLSSSIGTVTSVLRMIRAKAVHYPTALLSSAFAILGAVFGARFTLLLDPKSIKLMVLVMVPLLLVFFLFRHDLTERNTYKEMATWKLYLAAALSGLVIGAYDGVFGPGTGTFLLMFNVGVMGFPMLSALGNARMTNLASNLAALTVFLLSDRVIFALGLCAAAFNSAGSFFGSGLAIKKGGKIIKVVMICIMIALMIKTANDLFKIF